MKHLFFALLFLVVAGCQPAPQPIVVPVPSQPAPPKEVPPEPLKEAPVPPIAPSTTYITGYQDGYFGTWLSPIRWAVADEYRNGWSAGNYDRRHGIPNKHPK